VSRLTLRST